MADNINRQARSASISRDALEHYKAHAGFESDAQLAKAPPPPRLNVRTIERARAGGRISLRNIQLLARKLSINAVMLKPAFGNDSNPRSFGVINDLHIARSPAHFDKLQNIAALVSEIQTKADLLQRLIVEALTPADSVIITINLSRDDALRFYAAFIDGSLTESRITEIKVLSPIEVEIPDAPYDASRPMPALPGSHMGPREGLTLEELQPPRVSVGPGHLSKPLSGLTPGSEQVQRIRAAASTLPMNQRTVVEMVMDGLSTKEVAERLEIPMNRVKDLWKDASKKLRPLFSRFTKLFDEPR